MALIKVPRFAIFYAIIDLIVILAEASSYQRNPGSGNLPRILILAENNATRKKEAFIYHTQTGWMQNIDMTLNSSVVGQTGSAKNGILCYLEEDKVTKIACTTLQPKVLEIPEVSLPENEFITTQIDDFGVNVYWKCKTGLLWVTSLESGASKVILPRMGNGVDRFVVDTLNGIIFWSMKDDMNHLWRAKLTLAETNGYPQAESMPNPGGTTIVGMAIDREKFRLYWISGSQLFFSDYNGGRSGQLSNFLSLVPSYADSPDPGLMFYKDRVYWISGFDLGSFDLVINQQRYSQRIEAHGRIISASIFEDLRPEYKVNPCDSLQCSHLCLPRYPQGIQCACPSWMKMVNETTCVPPAILIVLQQTSGKQNGTIVVNDFTRFSWETPLNSSTNVSLSVGNFKWNSTDFGFQQRNSVSEPLKCIPGFKTSGYVYPLAVNEGTRTTYFLDSNKGCVQIFKGDSNETVETLFCSPSIDVSQVATDPYNGLFFWRNKLDGYIYKRDLADGSSQSVVIPRSDFANVPEEGLRIALQPSSSTIFWLSGTSLKNSTYSGDDSRVLLEFPSDSRNFGLHHQDGHLFWIEHYGDEYVITTLDLNTMSRITVMRIPVGRTKSIVSLMPVPLLTWSECSAPQAVSEATISVSKILASSSTAQTSVSFSKTEIQSSSTINPNIDLKVPTPAASTGRNEPLIKLIIAARLRTADDTVRISETDEPEQFFIDNFPRSSSSRFLFAASKRSNRTCWAMETPGVVICSINSSVFQTYFVPDINTENPIFALNNRGDELYTNSASNESCITLTSLKTNSSFQFQCFKSSNIGVHYLETTFKIIYWYDKQDGWIHSKTLTENSKPNDVLKIVTNLDVSGLIPLNNATSFVLLINENLLRVEKDDTVQDPLGPQLKNMLLTSLKGRNPRHLRYFNDTLYYSLQNADSSVVIESLRLNYNESDRIQTVFQTTDEVDILNFQLYLNASSDGKDPCENSHCSHFCFATPESVEYSANYQCNCPSGFRLHGFECVEEAITCLLSNPLLTAIVVPLVIIVMGVIFTIAWIMKSRENERLIKAIYELLQGNATAATSATNNADRARFLPFTCVVPPDTVSVHDDQVLGEGHFGIVYEGTYEDKAVAVKTVKPGTNAQLLTEFAREIKLMAYVGDHENIVRFFGAEISQIHKGKLSVVLELSPYGNLLTYLRQTKKYYPQENDGYIILRRLARKASFAPHYYNDIPFEVLVYWAEQIAHGMAFLEAKHVVHGDLACRNVLVFENNKVKISDFGLSRNLYQYSTYIKNKASPLPWRWAAIETLECLEFSHKSDIWGYGVTLWEIFSRGNVPYPELEWTKDFVGQLKEGYRLAKPELVSDEIYDDVMMPCWNLESAGRPGFADLADYFHSLRHDMPKSKTSVVYTPVIS